MKRHHDVYLLFSMLLLLMFAAASFYLLSTEIFAYQHVNETINQQDDCTLPLAYVHTKLKHIGNMNDVEIKQEPFPCMILHEEKVTTYLYYHNGYLMELIAVPGYKPTFTEGNKLFALDAFTMQKEKQLIKLSAKVHGKKEQLSVHLYGKEG